MIFFGVACTQNPCLHGGTCVREFDDSFRCICQQGYSGNICNVENVCVLRKPCLNKGVCTNAAQKIVKPEKDSFKDNQIEGTDGLLSEPQSNAYRCECVHPYIGSNCELVDGCFELCLNGGTCVGSGSNNASCTCVVGFYGKKCQFYNPCLSNPCKNSGSCSIRNFENSTLPSTYICKCIFGYFGDTCENYNPCWNEPCLNNGTCQASFLSFRCLCKLGYQGEYCQWLNPCLSEGLSNCSNGATCINSVSGQFRCLCRTGFISCMCFSINFFKIFNSFSGFYGQKCDKIDSCMLMKPCLNGGNCSSLGDGRILTYKKISKTLHIYI